MDKTNTYSSNIVVHKEKKSFQASRQKDQAIFKGKKIKSLSDLILVSDLIKMCKARRP